MMAYEQLDAWKSAHALVLAVHQVMTPGERHDPHVIRLMRSALRASGRLAFGSGARSRTLFRRAAERAAGHLSEFAYQLAVARMRGVLTGDVVTRLAALRGRATFYTWQLLEQLQPAGGGPQESDR